VAIAGTLKLKTVGFILDFFHLNIRSPGGNPTISKFTTKTSVSLSRGKSFLFQKRSMLFFRYNFLKLSLLVADNLLGTKRQRCSRLERFSK
jgi:hypothetical protein